MAPALLDGLPDAPGWVVGDRGLSSGRLRGQAWSMGARPAIPAKKNGAPGRTGRLEERGAGALPRLRPHPPQPRRNAKRLRLGSSAIERLWGRPKEWRAVATRYKKTACSFMGAPCPAAARDWLKPAIKSK